MGNTSSLEKDRNIRKAIIRHKNTKIKRLLENIKSRDDFISFINRPIDKYNDTLLDISLISANYEIAEILLDIDGINVDNVTKGGITTLMCMFIGIYQISLSKNIDLAKEIENGAKYVQHFTQVFDIADKIESRNEQSFEILRNTILRVAKKIIRLSYGNTVIVPDNKNRTAFDYLLDLNIKSSFDVIISIELKIRLARLLLNYGADIMNKSSSKKIQYEKHTLRLVKSSKRSEPIKSEGKLTCGTGLMGDRFMPYDYTIDRHEIRSIERALYIYGYGCKGMALYLIKKTENMYFVLKELYNDMKLDDHGGPNTETHIWRRVFRFISYPEVERHIIEKYRNEVDIISNEIKKILPQPISEEIEEYNKHRMLIQLLKKVQEMKYVSDSSDSSDSSDITHDGNDNNDFDGDFEQL